MDAYLFLAIHVLVYSAFPVFFATRTSSMRLVYLYVYISIVHVVGGFLGTVFSISLADGVTISGGSLAYAAFMMSAVVLVIIGRDPQVIRNVVKLVIIANLFKVALFWLTSTALDSPLYLNPFDTDPLVFTLSLRVVVVGGALIILELLLLVAVFERLKSWVKQPLALLPMYVALFVAVLCLDGLLFPPLAFPSDPALGALIATGVKAKFVLGMSFAIPLTAFLLGFRQNLVRYEMAPMRLAELFVAPREELVQQIGRQQTELEASEEKYRQLAESIDDVLFTLDTDLRFTYWNRAAERFSHSADEVLGRRYQEVFPETELLPLFAETMTSQKPGRVQQEGELESGETVVLDISVFPSPQGITILARDVTEASRLQRRLLQSQKMEAVGQLAGGVAHDFNNLLSVINNYSAFVHQSLPDGDRNKDDVAEVLKAGQRAADLVRQLLTFSRLEEVTPALLNLDEVIDDMSGLLRRTIPESIQLSIALDSGACVMMDRTQLEQAILNLLVNARDAMPSGGQLSITTGKIFLADEPADHRGVVPGEYGVIRVRDTGLGMTEEVVGRIFEPFFTTKERGAGTGLGLSGAYGAITRAGGKLDVSTGPGQGSTFEIVLPSAAAEMESEGVPDAARRGGNARVLVVEDEETIRRIAQRILEGEGYRVTLAESPKEALQLLSTASETIDLLLTDVVMPGMSGTQLVERARELRPTLRVLYMTGYPDQVQFQHGITPSGDDLLMKPFSAEELLSAVTAVLRTH